MKFCKNQIKLDLYILGEIIFIIILFIWLFMELKTGLSDRGVIVCSVLSGLITIFLKDLFPKLKRRIYRASLWFFAAILFLLLSVFFCESDPALKVVHDFSMSFPLALGINFLTEAIQAIRGKA